MPAGPTPPPDKAGSFFCRNTGSCSDIKKGGAWKAPPEGVDPQGSVLPFSGDPAEVFAQALAELLAAVFQVGAPALPAGVAHPLFGVDVADRDQNAGLLHAAEVGVHHRVEHAHRGREIHVGVDQRRDVLVELPDLLDQDVVVLHVGLAREEFS